MARRGPAGQGKARLEVLNKGDKYALTSIRQQSAPRAREEALMRELTFIECVNAQCLRCATGDKPTRSDITDAYVHDGRVTCQANLIHKASEKYAPCQHVALDRVDGFRGFHRCAECKNLFKAERVI